MPEVTRACSASRAILLHLHLFLNKLHALCNSFAFSCHVTAVLKPFPLSLCWINNSLVTEMLEIHFFFFLISMWKWWVFPPRSMCVWPGMCEHWWGFSCKSTCVPEVVRAQSQLTEEHYWGKTAASSRKRFPDTTACYTESYHGRKGSRVKKEKTISRGFVKGKPAVRGNACLQLVGDKEVATHILVLLPHAALSFCFSHCCLLWTPQLGERWKHSHISSEHRNKLEQHFTHFIEKAAPVTASPAAQHREGSRSYTLGEGLPWVNCFKASPTPLCLNLVTACTKASTPDKPFTVHKLQSSELQTYTGRN